jgi:hypothetical protein
LWQPPHPPDPAIAGWIIMCAYQENPSLVQRWNRIAFDTIRFALATVIGAAGLPLTASAQENKIKIDRHSLDDGQVCPNSLSRVVRKQFG